LRDRPTRGLARINLIWMIGLTAGIVAGGIVAYSLASGPSAVTTDR
jgi:hypothetical protein